MRNTKLRHMTVTNLKTPQYKNKRSPSAVIDLSSEKCKTDEHNKLNVFARHLNRNSQRKESIFSHASCDISVRCDPNTGKEQINNYILIKPVGKGSFAEVFLGYNIDDK